MRTAHCIAALCLAVPAGCDGDDADRRDSPVPDRVRVPRTDDSPPAATVVLALPSGRTLAEASQPGESSGGVVELERPRLRGTTAGLDPESGVVRVRVSIQESVWCRAPGGATEARPRRRYFPPSQIERATAAPGARIPTRERRTRVLRLGREACARGWAPVGGRGELWGDVTNGLGLEAVTPHIRFAWRHKRVD